MMMVNMDDDNSNEYRMISFWHCSSTVYKMKIMTIMIMTNGLMQKMLMTGTVKFQHMEDSVYNPVSFSSHHTYLGMPQVRQLHCAFLWVPESSQCENVLFLKSDGTLTKLSETRRSKRCLVLSTEMILVYCSCVLTT